MQIRKKYDIEKKLIQEDKKFYEQFGLTATEKFYVSEDQRRDRNAKIRGGAKQMAAEINDKFR